MQDINELAFWHFEENIKIVNEIIEDKEKHRKSEEDKQKTNMPSMNANSYTSGFSNIANKFK